MSSSSSAPAGTLRTSTMFFYGLGDIPIMMTLVPMSIYLSRFYTGDVGLQLAVVADILFLTRMFDVVTDPLVGYLSDHTKSRWGRRKPWVVASVPVLMLGVYNVFIPPEGAGIAHLAIWLLVLWLGWTMLMIPYYAWAAELSTNYDERTRITGWRAIMGTVGQLAAQLIPLGALTLFAFGGTANVMFLLGTTAMVMIPVCIALVVWRVPERPNVDTKAVVPMLQGLKLMWRNGPFRSLAASYFFSYFGLAITMSMFIFYVEFILEEPAKNVPYMLMVSTGASFIGVPLWVWISKYIGKHHAWICGFLLVTAMHPMYLLLGPGDFWNMAPILMIIGIGTGSFQALPNSMKADVIDLDTARSGQNRAALYFSTWSLITKLSSSVGGWLALRTLAYVGFDAKNGAENTDSALFGLQMVFAILPAIFFIIAVAIIWRYPITRERQQRIRAALDKRAARRAAVAD